MLEAVEALLGEEDADIRRRVINRTTGWRRRYAAETLGAAVSIGVAAAVVSRSLVGPLSIAAFHGLIGTLIALCTIYGLVSYGSLRRGLGAEGEQLVDGFMRLVIGTLAVVVGTSIVNPYAWKQDQAWYAFIFWTINGLGIGIITVNQWQLEVSRLRGEGTAANRSAATNHGLVLLVATGAASSLTGLGFIDQGLLPAPLFTVCLWGLAGLSLAALVSLQIEPTFPRFAPYVRSTALWATALAILGTGVVLAFFWGEGTFWSRLAPIAVLVVISIVTLSQLLEGLRVAPDMPERESPMRRVPVQPPAATPPTRNVAQESATKSAEKPRPPRRPREPSP